MSLFLSPPELQDLTGYKSRALQRKWLTERSWRFEVDRLGFPKVLRAEMERRMLGKGGKREKELNLQDAA